MQNNRKGNWLERNPKKIIAFLLLIFILLTGYAAEKILAYKNKGLGFNFALPHRAIQLREYRPTMQEYVQAGQEDLFYDNLEKKQYLLRIDENGFIIPSERHKNPDVTLAFLGASTSECRYVAEDLRFPCLTGTLLEKELNIKINSYNAARSGNHTLHSIDVLLNKVLPVNPQIVIMMHNINDLVILLYEKSYWHKNSARSLIIDINKEVNCFKVLRDRYIPNLAAALRNLDYRVRSIFKSKELPGPAPGNDEFAQVRGQKVEFDPTKVTEQFAMNLQTFIYCCQARKVTPVLMTMASRLKPIPDKVIGEGFKVQEAQMQIKYAQYKGLFDRFNEALRRKAEENGVLLIDLAREIPPEKEYMYDVVHFTELGSRRVAEIVAEKLKPLVAAQLQQKVTLSSTNSLK
jgi:hypothetical protein